MEILLNAYFSYGDSETMVGSLLGGSYVNNHNNKFAPSIERGQMISQAIDTFIESSPVCQKSIELLSPRARKYSLTILRLYYDHFLAKNWDKYSKAKYETFCADVIDVLKTQNDIFPYKPKRVANRIIRKNLISKLSTINGLNEYIQDMTRYNSYNSSISESIGDLIKNYDSFSKDFESIFPSLEKSLVFETEKNLLSIAS